MPHHFDGSKFYFPRMVTEISRTNFIGCLVLVLPFVGTYTVKNFWQDGALSSSIFLSSSIGPSKVIIHCIKNTRLNFLSRETSIFSPFFMDEWYHDYTLASDKAFTVNKCSTPPATLDKL